MTQPSLQTSETARSITLDQAVIGRGGLPLTAPLSLNFAAGTATVLQGPNGIGKTSLLRVLAGLLPVLDGEVSETLSGDSATPVVPFDASWLTLIGWLPVAPGLPPSLNAQEILRQAAGLQGRVDASRIGQLLDQWGLSTLADLPTQYLSAGQRRRVDLARLQLSPKPIWLLDEPAVTLDKQGRALLHGAIETHRQAGGLIVMASHDDREHEGWKYLTLTPAAFSDELADELTTDSAA